MVPDCHTANTHSFAGQVLIAKKNKETPCKALADTLPQVMSVRCDADPVHEIQLCEHGTVWIKYPPRAIMSRPSLLSGYWYNLTAGDLTTLLKFRHLERWFTPKRARERIRCPVSLYILPRSPPEYQMRGIFCIVQE